MTLVLLTPAGGLWDRHGSNALLDRPTVNHRYSFARSVEVLHQHQVARRVVDSREDDRAAVRRDAEAQSDPPTKVRHDPGPAGRKLEESKLRVPAAAEERLADRERPIPAWPLVLFDVVDALVEHDERPLTDAVEHAFRF